MSTDLAARLRAALSDFDGNAVTVLSEAGRRLKSEDGFLLAAAALSGDDDPLLQRGASWLILDDLKSGGAPDAAVFAALADRLDAVTDWQAVLHVLQALDHLNAPHADAARFAAFARAHLNSDRPFLRAWAMNAMCRLASFHPDLKSAAAAAHAAALTDPAASVRARARRRSFPKSFHTKAPYYEQTHEPGRIPDPVRDHGAAGRLQARLHPSGRRAAPVRAAPGGRAAPHGDGAGGAGL